MEAQILQIASQKENFITKMTDGEMMLVPLKDEVVDFNQFLTLNEVGAFIWENLEIHDTIESLTTKVCSEFDAEASEVATDIRAFLTILFDYLKPSLK